MSAEKNNKLTTSVYIKPTSNGDCLNFESICPDRYKTGVVKTLLHRGYAISADWNEFHEEINRIKQLLTNNNFPMRVIDDEVNKFLRMKLVNHNRNENVNAKEVNHLQLFYKSVMST